MNVYWRYRCDFGHEWTLFRLEDAAERPDDTRCAFGHEAVTLSKEPPVDRVQIAFRPAGRVVDPLKKQSWGDKRYYVVLSNMDGTEHRVSDTTYEWREAVALAEKFHGLTKEQAWARFASLPDVRSVLPHDS